MNEEEEEEQEQEEEQEEDEEEDEEEVVVVADDGGREGLLIEQSSALRSACAASMRMLQLQQTDLAHEKQKLQLHRTSICPLHVIPIPRSSSSSRVAAQCG